MANQTKRKEKPQNIVAKFWNEFLFTREFEYETPLSPDEIADTLQEIENKAHKSWFLSASTLEHHFQYERNGDKAGEFTIELASKNRNKWWETKSALQYSEGTLTANQETGLTIIKGSTRFNKEYYLLFLFMFSVNFFTQTLDNQFVFQAIWIAIIIAFWYSMYHERNKLADHIDNLIMNAKSNQSAAKLVDDEQDSFFDEHSQNQREYLSL